mmetsp:Transcript_6462/g.18037  ORF Transcript_6462/g.18037 Transcript_6462/m.18037 type:complete len:250 (-) Transcript_6462:440-1189(-)
MIHDSFVLLYRQGTRGVHDVATRLRVRIDHVHRRSEQLFLQPAVISKIGGASLDLDGGVAGDDTRTTTRRVEQHPVGPGQHLAEHLAIKVRHHHICQTHAVDVGDQRFAPVLPQVVCEEGARVLHELSDVSRLSTRSGRHVQNDLILLRRQCHDGDEGGGALNHVLSSQVLRRGSHWHLGVVHLQPHLRPVSHWLDCGLPCSEVRNQKTPPCLQRISADGQGSLLLVGLEELQCLLWAEHQQEILRQFF